MSTKLLPAEIEKSYEERREHVLEQGQVFEPGTKDALAEDAVFGQITEDGPNYRGVRTPHSYKPRYPPRFLLTPPLASRYRSHRHHDQEHHRVRRVGHAVHPQ